jgi:hypothetical protein
MFKSMLLCLLAMFICQITLSAQDISLEEAFQKELVSIKIKTSGHSGECVQLTLVNTAKRYIKIIISPGDVLASADSTCQDLLVVDAGTYTMQANQKRQINLSAYCCKMRRAGSSANAIFRYEGKINENLTKIASYLYKNQLKSSPMAQEAIWAVSDTASLSLIFDKINKEKSMKLIEYTAAITGQKVPWFRLEAKKVNPGPQIVKRELVKMHADWEFDITQSDVVTFEVLDAQGKQVATFFKDKNYKSGKYIFSFTYETNKLAKGNYFFRMTGKVAGKLEERVVVL